eukprot:scaffold5944_cov248-Pinguiococcus_pyrenoidosus.AAC.4
MRTAEQREGKEKKRKKESLLPFLILGSDGEARLQASLGPRPERLPDALRGRDIPRLHVSCAREGAVALLDELVADAPGPRQHRLPRQIQLQLHQLPRGDYELDSLLWRPFASVEGQWPHICLNDEAAQVGEVAQEAISASEGRKWVRKFTVFRVQSPIGRAANEVRVVIVLPQARQRLFLAQRRWRDVNGSLSGVGQIAQQLRSAPDPLEKRVGLVWLGESRRLPSPGAARQAKA